MNCSFHGWGNICAQFEAFAFNSVDHQDRGQTAQRACQFNSLRDSNPVAGIEASVVQAHWIPADIQVVNGSNGCKRADCIEQDNSIGVSPTVQQGYWFSRLFKDLYP